LDTWQGSGNVRSVHFDKKGLQWDEAEFEVPPKKSLDWNYLLSVI